MHVAMLSPISWRTPPRHYGPWELVTSHLTEGLIGRGIEVTLFATGDSVTKGRLASVVPRGYSEDPTLDAKVSEILHIANLFERADQFDLIHNQFDFVPLAFSRLCSKPMITTIHGFSSPKILPAYAAYQDRVHYVSISDADRSPMLKYAATIHHGIPIGEFPFAPLGSDRLLFFGRIHPDKGLAEAIAVAKAAGLALDIAGIVQDERYFETRVKPHIDGEQIVFHGAVGGAQRAQLLGGARALLHLINFDEPFGLSVVEALACGTPVIAMRRGSMPELIDDGRTGFLVGTVEQALDAITRLDEIDRRNCRQAAELRFSVDTMVDKYITLYTQAVQNHSAQ